MDTMSCRDGKSHLKRDRREATSVIEVTGRETEKERERERERETKSDSTNLPLHTSRCMEIQGDLFLPLTDSDVKRHWWAA